MSIFKDYVIGRRKSISLSVYLFFESNLTMAEQRGNPSFATQSNIQNSGGSSDSAGDGAYVILTSVDDQGRILVGVEGDADG